MVSRFKEFFSSLAGEDVLGEFGRAVEEALSRVSCLRDLVNSFGSVKGVSIDCRTSLLKELGSILLCSSGEPSAH